MVLPYLENNRRYGIVKRRSWVLPGIGHGREEQVAEECSSVSGHVLVQDHASSAKATLRGQVEIRTGEEKGRGSTNTITLPKQIGEGIVQYGR